MPPIDSDLSSEYFVKSDDHSSELVRHINDRFKKLKNMLSQNDLPSIIQSM